MKKNQGFTLVELIIVISVIAVLAAVAIPNFLRVKVHSNESAAVGNLRTMSSAAEAFRSTQNPPAYAASFDVMVNTNPSYLDSAWTSGPRQGYVFTYSVAGDNSTFSTTALPQFPNISGVNSYCVDQTGVVRRYPPGGGGAENATGCNIANGIPI